MTRALGYHRLEEAPADPSSIEVELALLETLDLMELRLRWRNHFGRRAPRHLSRPLLWRIFAHRIQEDAYGSLSRESERLLHRLAKGDASPSSSPASSLKPGTVLAREWQGRMEQVMVLEDGFAWQGRRFASLSATAFAITGTRWNGRAFFGLRERGDRRRRMEGLCTAGAFLSSMEPGSPDDARDGAALGQSGVPPAHSAPSRLIAMAPAPTRVPERAS